MRSILFLSAALVPLTLTACVQVQQLRPEMTIQVKPSGANAYTVQGRTSLPGETEVLVQAVRQLQPLKKGDRQPTYTIVAQERTTTTVEGSWQASLKLRQSQGQALESWQQNSATKALAVKASPQLKFIATTMPIPRDLRLEGDVTDGVQPQQRSSVLKVDTNGNRFLQAQQTLDVPPPASPKGAVAVLKRAVVKVPAKAIAPDDTVATSDEASKSNAPLKIDELVR